MGSLKPLLVSTRDEEMDLAAVGAPLPMASLASGSGPWEVEIGFGKGRYLLERAAAAPEDRFLGIEMARRYHGILVERARRRGLGNLVAIRGEASYLLSAVLPTTFARAVHVYFPDPWPKSRHHKRRLFDAASLDLVLGLLEPGGTLWFATDHLEYGALVQEILEGYPGLAVERVPEPWPEGPRTNYEAKYMREGRPILRLQARCDPSRGPEHLHPAGQREVVAAWAPKEG